MIKKTVSKIYAGIVRRRNHRYDSGLIEIVKCKAPVISIGNLGVGGTGKTPLAIMLCKMLLKQKHRPGIVGLGYKRKSKGTVIVSDGENILADAAKAGDEMLMAAMNVKVPVVVGESKSKSAVFIEEQFDVDCIIIDDGFQHRKLFRDMDILILDKETIENPDLLPLGRLREPISSVKRADVICLKGAMRMPDEIRKYVKKGAEIISVKALSERPYGLIDNTPAKRKDIKSIKDGTIVACGIAKPDNFVKLLEGHKVNVIKCFDFSDHHFYSESDIEGIAKYCREKGIMNLAVTEKDAVKLKEFSRIFEDNNLKCNVFPIDLFISYGNGRLRRKINDLFN